MSEHEYRERLAAVIATLKRRAQRALRPAAVGVALLATGGCADDAEPPARDAIIAPDNPLYGDAFVPADGGLDAPTPIDSVLPPDIPLYADAFTPDVPPTGDAVMPGDADQG